MKWDRNPFQELYVSDSVSEEAFVELFSPVPLTSAIHPLFQEGNVVLSGTQGCGKSMLLRLFFPETRIAYAEKLGKGKFPVTGRAARFVSAGVNLVKSALCDIGQVTLGEGDTRDIERLPYFFGDWFNYWVIGDLFRNLRTIAEHEAVFDGMVHIERGERFAECLVQQDCWFGLLDGCASLEDIERRVAVRIEAYRSWTMMNDHGRGVPEEIATRKTAVGEPIARTVECLKRTGVLAKDANVFVRVDQLDELHQQPLERQRKLRDGFRRMLNRAFASRDARLHYRVGTRRYGWNQPEHLVVHGSGARLENRRDYYLIDLDDELARKEVRRSWSFPRFAADVFRRRVKYSFEHDALREEGLFAHIFGKSPTSHERAGRFAPEQQSAAALDRIFLLDEGWSEEWKTWLRDLARKNPLDAVLAAAWGRQTGGGGRKAENRRQLPPTDDSWKKKWWLKERQMQAVLQLAARRAQRLLWWGSDDVIALSGSNITTFLHLCHTVWDLFLKEESLKDEAKRGDLMLGGSIPVDTQAAGLQDASRQWRDKLGEQPGGDVRRRLIDQLGRHLRVQLRDDLAMRYPGGNGFSLRDDQLEASENRALWSYLRGAVGYGDLTATRHTTKNSRGEARTKFYLNPVLSPYFQVPAAHTKEPLYWNVEQLMALARDAKIPFALELPADDPKQLRFL